MSRMGKAEAIEQLQALLGRAPELKNSGAGSPEFVKWKSDVSTAICYIFGELSHHLRDFNDVRYNLYMYTSDTPDHEFHAAYARGLGKAAALIESMIDEIRNYWRSDEQAISPVDVQAEQDGDTGQLVSRRIFLVHGRDEGAKSAVARFLEKLDLQPVILDEQANRGLTIIEKFESHSDVGFAIVLLTPDDEGALRGDEKSGRHRARQNVIFELGFFIGRLGRQRVCALTKESAMEIPSDYSGVVYIPLDEGGGWQLALIKELKAADLDVDPNRVL